MKMRDCFRMPFRSRQANIGASLLCTVMLAAFFTNARSIEKSASDDFFTEKISCPTPAVDEYQPWGKSGTQHICKIKHGPFVAWENGYIHIRGQYEYGKDTGAWFWYDAGGKVVKQIDYSGCRTEK